MESKHKCQQCGKPTEPNGLDGLCPRCMMKVGIGSYSNPPEGPASQGFVPPAIKDLVPLFPDLEVLELIGKGGMGVVYKARQKHLDRIVALKILPPGIGAEPAFAERLTREARALARLNHPGVVTLYESGCADGLYFFLMEFVDGVSLRHLLEVGRISPREALAIVPQICDALQYAHDQGIVHRDIKPENILLDRQGRVKVADFGLAKLVGSAAETVTPGDTTGKSVTLTEAGKVMGTPQYMAPEQGEHPSDVDHRADIYSLGVVFYQMLTGELPGKPIEPPSGKVQVDVRLDEVVLRALEKEPERRYQQVSQVKTAVETIAQSRSPVDASAQPADWMMWSPFQSRQVREICAHMTEAEKREATIRGALFSVWIVTTCFGPFFAVEFMPRPMGWFIGPIIFLVGIACFPVWRRMTREFLCTTAWARQQALKPDDLRYAAGRASAVGGEATDRRVETRPRAVWPWIKAIAGMVLLLSVVLIVALLFTRGCTVQEAVYRKEKKQIVKEVHLASVRSQSFTRLPQGEVELVGISFHPSANQPWWRSDGSPCQEGPFELRGGRSGGTDVITREFVIRLKGLPADASGPTWKLDPSYGQSSGEVFIDGQPAKDLHGITTSLPKSAREVTLKVGIGMGPWQTVAKQVPGGSNMLDVIHEGARWTASLLRPENTDSGAKITVVHTVKNREMRMLAVDHENGEHSSSRTETKGADPFSHLTAKFSGLPLEQVKEFQFQLRSYQWVEFRGVALYPKSQPDEDNGQNEWSTDFQQILGYWEVVSVEGTGGRFMSLDSNSKPGDRLLIPHVRAPSSDYRGLSEPNKPEQLILNPKSAYYRRWLSEEHKRNWSRNDSLYLYPETNPSRLTYKAQNGDRGHFENEKEPPDFGIYRIESDQLTILAGDPQDFRVSKGVEPTRTSLGTRAIWTWKFVIPHYPVDFHLEPGRRQTLVKLRRVSADDEPSEN